jgi:cell filamentation protein
MPLALYRCRLRQPSTKQKNMSDKYGTGEDRHYCYPGSDVLINKLRITDPTALASAEVSLTQARLQTFEPDFEDFSLSALRKIHFHLFQDIYSWAGSLRTIDVSKGATRFANALRIEPEADKLFETVTVGHSV